MKLFNCFKEVAMWSNVFLNCLPMILGKINVDLLSQASSREVRCSGKLLPCPWADRMSCHCPSWMSATWEWSGTSGPGGPGHSLWVIITAPGPFHYTGHEVAIPFVKFHLAQLEDRHWLLGKGRMLTYFMRLTSPPQSQGAWVFSFYPVFTFCFLEISVR